ncbi:MAG: hypothetical protein IKV17_00640 [Bacteroidaceae bacterium]|nr:hypothetical protein [Bacteroidaceae bacterium]
MKKLLFIFAALFVALAVVRAEEKNKADEKKGVYIFGTSFSFSDSIVYFTEIQYLEEVQLEDKTNFIPFRQHYSYELKDFMSKEGMPGRISAVYFSHKESDVKKKEAKLKKRLEKKDKKVVRYLGSKFKFTKP